MSNTSNYDFLSDVVTTPDGGCCSIINNAFEPLVINQSGLLRFSPDGELVWQKYYQSEDGGVDDQYLHNLITTPDQGFLLTGFCYYPDPENPSIYWVHPYYVKVDSSGQFPVGN